ncbi:hypothetical protein HDU85_006995 [Gaertneriomyces sp. JEL0708]|nr:hypothetical protein HDU85_006995 [Gaertneriomyces sp. JEL0708]
MGRIKQQTAEPKVDKKKPIATKDAYKWTREQDAFMKTYYRHHGGKWSEMASALNAQFGVDSKMIQNHWRYLKKEFEQEERQVGNGCCDPLENEEA